MKHSIRVTVILLLVFLLSQIVGLYIINGYIDQEATAATGNVTYSALPLGMEPPPTEGSTSLMLIIFAVLIGTGILLLFVKFKLYKMWKIWFLFAVVITLTIALDAFIKFQLISIIIAILLGLWKVFKPNFLIHNITEIFIYGGLAALLVPIFDLVWVIALLVLISIYDMIAVWQSKHMIKLANFQTGSSVFAGLNIPYDLTAKNLIKTKKHAQEVHHTSKAKVTVKDGPRTAILGGGDMAFPLIFAGVVMKTTPLVEVLIIPVMVLVALGGLLFLAKKNRFYPAMPFVTLGCAVGYGILLLL